MLVILISHFLYLFVTTDHNTQTIRKMNDDIQNVTAAAALNDVDVDTVRTWCIAAIASLFLIPITIIAKDYIISKSSRHKTSWLTDGPRIRPDLVQAWARTESKVGLVRKYVNNMKPLWHSIPFELKITLSACFGHASKDVSIICLEYMSSELVPEFLDVFEPGSFQLLPEFETYDFRSVLIYDRKTDTTEGSTDETTEIDPTWRTPLSYVQQRHAQLMQFWTKNITIGDIRIFFIVMDFVVHNHQFEAYRIIYEYVENGSGGHCGIYNWLHVFTDDVESKTRRVLRHGYDINDHTTFELIVSKAMAEQHVYRRPQKQSEQQSPAAKQSISPDRLRRHKKNRKKVMY